MKLSLLISAVANGPRKVATAGERTSDIHMLRGGPWVKDPILLLDLGHYKYQLFARIAENGGYFVTLPKENANPLVIGSYTIHRGHAVDGLDEANTLDDPPDGADAAVLDSGAFRHRASRARGAWADV